MRAWSRAYEVRQIIQFRTHAKLLKQLGSPAAELFEELGRLSERKLDILRTIDNANAQLEKLSPPPLA